jgi:predicted GNAT superfamily acetyltransferase
VAATTTTGELVGFAYGFVGFDGLTPYLYSQAAFIDPNFQGQGVGRQLKQAQREIATAAGLTSMRWAFDPILARNAHFNLDVLGATGVKFAPRYYDEPFSDRLVVDWNFQAAARTPAPIDRTSLPAITSRDWGMPLTSGTSILIPIPARSPEKTLQAQELDSLRITIAETFTAVTSQKYAAVSCERVDETSAVYVFVPVEDL